MNPKPRSHNDYAVGWVCALSKEQTAAIAVLDETHDDLPKPPNDHNTYILGSIGDHNIVITCLPEGKIGTSSAATAVVQMVRTFPAIKSGLMVGIGGGIPPKVRLGDVVVSKPTGQYPGVVQWDSGKAEDGGKFVRTDKSRAINRKPREMKVHYGLITSGNQVVKDATFRDNLNKDLGGNVLCVEMEAAGLMGNFPCIVIRGVCDYADSHKNKAWQEHAAAVAAAFAKELLGHVQPSDLEGERAVKDILNSISNDVSSIKDNMTCIGLI
ncbi:putative kinesin light protein [Eutypa lata UCREL1]|uniref:Putative kinesin light protein n=1 Tax=Eutypa lata (strain UCR-EL1) TaxID=1287681 RepID=M7TPT0_EUTLA|nr:putative kinesin light protein [Eutypa lata UCREL1]